MRETEHDINVKIGNVDSEIDEIIADFLPHQENLKKEKTEIEEKELMVTEKLVSLFF